MNFELVDILRVPISYVIKGAYYLIPNYAVAVILFAIVMQIILLPLGIKQQKNLVKQARLQPRIDAINKRYAGRTDQKSKQDQNQEIMDLYQKEGYNPMGGCLPLLIQLPILFSLYNVIINPLKYLCNLSNDAITAISNKIYELYGAIKPAIEAGEYAGDIPQAFLDRLAKGNLSAIEQVKAMRYFGVENFSEYLGDVTLPEFTLFGLDLSNTPSLDFSSLGAIILLLIPVLSFVFAFLSMRIAKKLAPQPQNDQTANMAASMKMMDWIMPLMSTYIAFISPALIGIYWIFRNILGTVQQLILKKLYPMPTFTEEERRAIEKEMNGKSKKKHNASASTTARDPNAPKPRSYHHIDDEDAPLPPPQAEADEDKPTTEKPKGIGKLVDRGEMQDED